jgi:hypothetical protein
MCWCFLKKKNLLLIEIFGEVDFNKKKWIQTLKKSILIYIKNI